MQARGRTAAAQTSVHSLTEGTLSPRNASNREGDRSEILKVCGFSAPGIRPSRHDRPSQAAERQNKLIWKRIVGIAAPGSLVGRPPGGADCNIGVDCVEGTPAQWTTTEGRAEGRPGPRPSRVLRQGSRAGRRSIVQPTSGLRRHHAREGDAGLQRHTTGVPELVDTDAVALSSRGNASFRGHVDLPASCVAEPLDMVFLIRIADPENFLFDFYNAFGAVRIGPGEGEPNGSD